MAFRTGHLITLWWEGRGFDYGCRPRFFPAIHPNNLLLDSHYQFRNKAAVCVRGFRVILVYILKCGNVLYCEMYGGKDVKGSRRTYRHSILWSDSLRAIFYRNFEWWPSRGSRARIPSESDNLFLFQYSTFPLKIPYFFLGQLYKASWMLLRI